MPMLFYISQAGICIKHNSFLFFFCDGVIVISVNDMLVQIIFKLHTEAVCIFRKQQNVTTVMAVNTNLILCIPDVEGILLLDAFNLIIAQKSAPSIPQRFMIDQSAFIQNICIVRCIKTIIADHKQDQECPCDDANLKQRVKGNRQYGYDDNCNNDKINDLLAGTKMDFPLVYLLFHGLPALLIDPVCPQIK